MASLRRSNNSPFWIACLTLPGGARTNRSTKLTDRRSAQKLADDWEDAARKAEAGRFVEAQARAVLNDILVKIGEESLAGDTTETFLRRWLAGKANPGTAKRYGQTTEAFLDHIGPKRSAPITTIGHQDVLAFMDARRESGIAGKTLFADLRSLGAAFNMARKLGLISNNPVERALALQPISVTPSQRQAFTPQQVTALLATAQGDWLTVVLLGFYTGARLSDCARMRWVNVDLGSGVVDYLPQKTERSQKRVVVPIHLALRAHLESLPRGGEFLCTSLADKETGGRNGLSEGFKGIMRAAGIAAPPGALSFHSLRHTFNSALANVGISQEVRMALTGHRCVATNHGYTHLDIQVLTSAVCALPGLCGAGHMEVSPAPEA